MWPHTGVAEKSYSSGSFLSWARFGLGMAEAQRLIGDDISKGESGYGHVQRRLGQSSNVSAVWFAGEPDGALKDGWSGLIKVRP